MYTNYVYDFCFCLVSLLLFLGVSSLRYTLGKSGTRDAPPCGCLPLSFFDLIDVPLPSSFILFRCVAHSLSLSLLCLPIWAVLHYLHMYMVAFLALRILYVVTLVCFVLFLGFPPPESLPGDDVLCRLLPRPLASVCFLFFFPTVLVPDLLLV